MSNINETVKAACIADMDELETQGGPGCEPWTAEIRSAANDVIHYLTSAVRSSRTAATRPGDAQKTRAALASAAAAEERLPASWNLNRAKLTELF